MKQSKAFAVVILVTLSIPVVAQWNVSNSTDEMTGEKSSYCSSSSIYPTKSMDFPYSDVKAWIGIGCDGDSEWAYIGFTTPPNLIGTDTQDSYDIVSTRIKWNDNLEEQTFTQTWGAKFLHFTDDKTAIQNIMESNTLLVELNWHGEGKTYFRFDLGGSSRSLTQMRANCN